MAFGRKSSKTDLSSKEADSRLSRRSSKSDVTKERDGDMVTAPASPKSPKSPKSPTVARHSSGAIARSSSPAPAKMLESSPIDVFSELLVTITRNELTSVLENKLITESKIIKLIVHAKVGKIIVNPLKASDALLPKELQDFLKEDKEYKKKTYYHLPNELVEAILKYATQNAELIKMIAEIIDTNKKNEELKKDEVMEEAASYASVPAAVERPSQLELACRRNPMYQSDDVIPPAASSSSISSAAIIDSFGIEVGSTLALRQSSSMPVLRQSGSICKRSSEALSERIGAIALNDSGSSIHSASGVRRTETNDSPSGRGRADSNGSNSSNLSGSSGSTGKRTNIPRQPSTARFYSPVQLALKESGAILTRDNVIVAMRELQRIDMNIYQSLMVRAPLTSEQKEVCTQLKIMENGVISPAVQNYISEMLSYPMKKSL